jgi:holin-like protein
LLSALGTTLVQTLAAPVPGSLVGMLLLLALLLAGVVKPADLQELTDPLLRHLAVLFVPFAVGAMAWSTLFRAHGLALVASLLGAAVVGLVASGASAQLIIRHGERGHAG